MTATEDPVTTLVRLLDTSMHVVNDDLSIAKILVTQAWYDRELLRNLDGQVTVALDHCEDEKIGFSASMRRRTAYLNVDVWTVDKPELGVAGRRMREKVCTEVNRIIREKRNKPGETTYDFVGAGPTAGSHKAYHAEASSELAPTDAEWSELTGVDYEKVWYSDDIRFVRSASTNLQYALALFRFKIDPEAQLIKQMVLKFEGYGTAPGGNGVTIKVWNFTASEWQNAASGNGGADEVVTITLASVITDFIDGDGYVYMLARTTFASDGVTLAVLYCDFIEGVITVEGITYCDVVSYRNDDLVNVKPFVWHTRFTVKAWLFETVLST